MAVVLTAKKLAIAQGFVNMARLLAAAANGSQIYDAEYVQQGITYVPGDFDNSALAYVDPADMPTLITRLETDFLAWWNNGTASAAGNLTSAILQKVLPGTPLSVPPSSPLF